MTTSNIFQSIHRILQKPFWSRNSTMLTLWLSMVVISVALHMHHFNNFLIYKYSFWHALEQKDLFLHYPEEYGDLHHYGPIFSMIIAPFAVIPSIWVGVFFWHLALALFLWWAIKKSSLGSPLQVFVIWFTAHELLNALGMSQFNVATAAMILLTFGAVYRGQNGWAAFWIALGTLVKVYGIVGMVFFLFSKNKPKFVLWTVFWMAFLFVLPMPFFGASYVLDQYVSWACAIADKGQENLLSDFQNISLLGMVRKIGYACTAGLNGYYVVFEREALPDPSNWWISTWSDLWLIIPALLYSALPWLRFRQYRSHSFQLMCLALLLIFVNIFSTGAENSSYIISMLGVAIWYVAAPWQRSRLDLCLLVFCFILTSLSPTDLFPPYIRTYWIRAFALKSLPVVLIWLKLVWEMNTKDFTVKKMSM